MARLLDDLLDISRIAQGKMLLQKERVVLQAVIDNALEMAKPAIESHGHRLSFEPGVIPTVELDADPLRVSQAIANLLTNAAKYTPVGGRIELKVQTHSEALSVIVKDSGIGLDSTSLKHVFEPFYQVGSALPRSEGGLGIGLALVKSMINLHGGNVEARSDGLGLGSEFTITLPLRQTGTRTPEQTAPSTPILASAAIAPSPLKLLVIDDNRDAASTLAQMLRLEGHEVHLAHDGREGLQAALQLQPDVAIVESARRIGERPLPENPTVS